MTMPDEIDQIQILDANYPVLPFTATQVLAVAKMLQETSTGNWELASFKTQCEAAEIVKEVIIPDLPESVITVSRTGRYVWMIELKDMTKFLTDLMRLYQVRQIRVAKAKNDKATLKALEQHLKEYDAQLSAAVNANAAAPQPEADAAEPAKEEAV